MNLTNDNLNKIFEKYGFIIDLLCNKYNYSNELREILYVLVPALVLKYENDEKVLSIFENTFIHYSEKPISDMMEKFLLVQSSKYNNLNKTIPALIYNSPSPSLDNKEIKIESIILISTYISNNPLFLLDNLVHELNHKTNAISNSLSLYENNILGIRLGMKETYYKISNNGNKFNHLLMGTKNNMFEEILNTIQTEEIIEIILSFKNFKIDNEIIYNYLEKLKINSKYKSQAYSYLRKITKLLTNNEQFYNKINEVRFNGEIDDFENEFDNVVGKEGSFSEFSLKLDNINELIFHYNLKQQPSLKFEELLEKSDIYLMYEEIINIILKYNINYFNQKRKHFTL